MASIASYEKNLESNCLILRFFYEHFSLIGTILRKFYGITLNISVGFHHYGCVHGIPKDSVDCFGMNLCKGSRQLLPGTCSAGNGWEICWLKWLEWHTPNSNRLSSFSPFDYCHLGYNYPIPGKCCSYVSKHREQNWSEYVRIICPKWQNDMKRLCASIYSICIDIYVFVYVYICTHTHTHTYIYMYVCIIYTIHIHYYMNNTYLYIYYKHKIYRFSS